MGNIQFEEFLAAEVEKSKGSFIPVKAGFFKRLFVKKALCRKLHPNPEDEFCIPHIGPSYRIISEYEKKFLNQEKRGIYFFTGEEPIIVEKAYPEGYLILNGHHRWAAAIRLAYPRIPIRIVNITHEADIRKALENSRNNKRVVFDLDEVVFKSGEDEFVEKPLPFPLSRMYPERLRMGIPALFQYFKKNGYDIWVYSAKYYSIDYIRAMFHKYNVHIRGIVTGTAKRTQKENEIKKELEELIANQYIFTVHIDEDTVLKITGKTGEFEEYTIEDPSQWAAQIMKITGEFDQHE